MGLVDFIVDFGTVRESVSRETVSVVGATDGVIGGSHVKETGNVA